MKQKRKNSFAQRFTVVKCKAVDAKLLSSTFESIRIQNLCKCSKSHGSSKRSAILCRLQIYNINGLIAARFNRFFSAFKFSASSDLNVSLFSIVTLFF